MGFHAMVAYVNSWANDPQIVNGGTSNPASPYNTKSNAWSLSAGYKIAGFGLDAAYEQHKMQNAVSSGLPTIHKMLIALACELQHRGLQNFRLVPRH